MSMIILLGMVPMDGQKNLMDFMEAVYLPIIQAEQVDGITGSRAYLMYRRID